VTSSQSKPNDNGPNNRPDPNSVEARDYVFLDLSRSRAARETRLRTRKHLFPTILAARSRRHFNRQSPVDKHGTTASADCAASHCASFIIRLFGKMAAPVAGLLTRFSTKAGALHVASAALSRAVRMLLHASEALTCAPGSLLLHAHCVSPVRCM